MVPRDAPFLAAASTASLPTCAAAASSASPVKPFLASDSTASLPAASSTPFVAIRLPTDAPTPAPVSNPSMSGPSSPTVSDTKPAASPRPRTSLKDLYPVGLASSACRFFSADSASCSLAYFSLPTIAPPRAGSRSVTVLPNEEAARLKPPDTSCPNPRSR